MKQKIHEMAFYMAFAMLPLLMSCSNNEENMEIPGVFDPFIGIYLSVENVYGDDLIGTLKVSPMQKGVIADAKEDIVALQLGTYEMDVYLDGKLVESSKSSDNEKTYYVVTNNPAGDGVKSLFLYSSAVQKNIIYETNTFDKKHIMEFHFTCEALFNDKDAIIRFEYDPIKPLYPAKGFYATVYFDGKKQESIYPEYFGIQPSFSGVGQPVVTLTLE